MLEKYLIRHCSPTLASLKTANLFSVRFEEEGRLKEQISLWNMRLRDKGVSLTLLRVRRKSALVYVYRKSGLRKVLTRPDNVRFLRRYGYDDFRVAEAVRRLKGRLQKSGSFPHEIGIFLGYPLKDVTGFIENGGENCKCADCWKVYGDEHEAQKIFAKLKKCQETYCMLWEGGKSVMQLTVAA